MHLSTEAWISLICVILLIAAINIPLFIVIVYRKPLRLPFIHDPNFAKLAKTVQRPWHEEESQMDELAKRVETLKEEPKE